MYERISQVGEGTYGQVFKARGEKTGVVVALKKIRMESEKDGFPVTAMREIKLLQGLRHPNVVRLHEMMLSKNSIYMVFEYLEHDLNGILSQPTVLFEPCHLKSLASQLLSGLAYLHHRSILHRDLKGSNLLLNNAGVLKLADFGLARSYMKRKRGDYTNRVVTLWYRPPELLLGATQYGAAVDVWGAGCIFLELFTRKPVLQGQDEIDQVKVLFEMLGRYGQGGGDGVDEEWPEMRNLPWYDLSLFSKYAPSDALDVVDRLLHFDPAKRASAAEVLELPYFAANEPKAERPARVLSAVEGEWHEYESRRARRQKIIQQREEQHQPQEDSMTLTDDKREASA
ncbi:Pkinase-domain-containing protein [Acaromyces ingoldii]|uniref:Pkinase-domain-containing protein n=1 Tax=Acaromyces ingoldii TaxID=215250 RepID=A0A316YGJ0_9BASI|nr:Pkinase-domain-containing protein [Acaromyces ingoldii]PWN88282.1 Pkinase-domain-containing protein [Acaromyces ingoldii]